MAIDSTSETANQHDKVDLEKGDGVLAHESAAKQDIKNESAAKQDSRNESAARQDPASELAWKGISNKVWEYENNRIDGWNKQIDTLLVFAGLFSAVVTAFNVQYYTSLQPPSGTQIMLRVPSDLTYHIHVSTLPSTVTSDAAVAATTVVINTLWFLALVLSLSAASIGITVKQWLSSYIPPKTMTSRQRTRLWHHRQLGLSQWRVPAIVSVLPNLLQLALLLFLVGLVVLLWTLNRVSAIVVMIPVATLIVLLGITSIIPAFVPKCPYKSPQAWWIFLVVHRVTLSGVCKLGVSLISNVIFFPYLVFHFFVDRSWRTNYMSIVLSWLLRVIKPRLRTPSCFVARDWLDRDIHGAAPSTSGLGVENIYMIVAADSVVRDDKFLQGIIVPAFEGGLDSSDSVQPLSAFYKLVQSRAERSSNGASSAYVVEFRHDMDSGLVEAMAMATLSMLNGIIRHEQNRDSLAQHIRKLLSILQALLDVLPDARPRVFVQLISLCCDVTTGVPYSPNNAREDDPVEVIARHAPHYKSKIEALPASQQTILGNRAMERLIQLLDDTSSDGSKWHHGDRYEPEDHLLGLLRMITDNRQVGVQFESSDVVTLCRRLGGADPILPKRIRTILIHHVACIVKSHPFRNASCIQDLAACLYNITHWQQQPRDYDETEVEDLLKVIAMLLNQLQPDDMTELAQPLCSALVDVIGLTGRTYDAYRRVGYLRLIVAVYEAMMRKQPHVFSEADLKSLEAFVAVITKGLNRDEVLQANLSSLRQLIAANTLSGDPSASSGADALPGGAEQPAAPV